MVLTMAAAVEIGTMVADVLQVEDVAITNETNKTNVLQVLMGTDVAITNKTNKTNVLQVLMGTDVACVASKVVNKAEDSTVVVEVIIQLSSIIIIVTQTVKVTLMTTQME